MSGSKLNKDDKQAELEKYRALVLATLDYYLDNKVMQIITDDDNAIEYFERLKSQAEEYYQKGRLTKLKQWFFDLTEMQIEIRNLTFNAYLQDKTKYDIDIFQSFFQRVAKVIERGKILTDNQFYDIKIMMDQLYQREPVDLNTIEMLGDLLNNYEHRKSLQLPTSDV